MSTGSRKHRFMVFTSIHARMYDMPSRFAASLSEPTSATSLSNSTFPGPSAMSFPQMTLKRGRNTFVFPSFLAAMLAQ